MNESIALTPRHKAIVTLLAQFEQLSREQISEQLERLYPVSKATLARDLAELLEKKLITAVGSGPSRVYQSASVHPLLKQVDLAQYFELEADQRPQVKTSFNFEIFNQLSGLIFDSEKQELDALFRSFTAETNRVDSTIRHRELERFVIELSWKSSKIEGNTYSLLDTERLIKEQRAAQGHPKQEAVMILNHKDAFQTIVQEKETFQNLTFNSVLELHHVLTQGLSIETGIRKHAVGITGTTYRPLDNEWQTRDALQQLITTVNATADPLEKGLIISSLIAYLQPFADGNKRTARMLANAILIAYDYFPLSYRNLDENEYKSAQLLFDETNNLYHLKRLFLEQYRFALSTYF